MRPEGPRRRRRVHARSNPKVPAEPQWDTEAQGPEHHGAYLEPMTCFDMIQQKSMHHKRDEEDSRHSAEDHYWQNLDARGDACTAVRETERHVNQFIHSGAGDLTANSDVGDSSVPRRGRVFKEKDRP